MRKTNASNTRNTELSFTSGEMAKINCRLLFPLFASLTSTEAFAMYPPQKTMEKKRQFPTLEKILPGLFVKATKISWLMPKIFRSIRSRTFLHYWTIFRGKILKDTF